MLGRSVYLQRLAVYSLAVLSILIIASGYVGWTYVKSLQTPPPSETPTPMPSSISNSQNTSPNNSSDEETIDQYSPPAEDPQALLLVQVEQARNNAMMFLQTTHPETAFLVVDEWQLGSNGNSNLTQRYDFYSGGWNATVTLLSNLMQSPSFSINLKYSSDWQVNWLGNEQNGTVTETSFSSNIPNI